MFVGQSNIIYPSTNGTKIGRILTMKLKYSTIIYKTFQFYQTVFTKICIFTKINLQ